MVKESDTNSSIIDDAIVRRDWHTAEVFIVKNQAILNRMHELNKYVGAEK